MGVVYSPATVDQVIRVYFGCPIGDIFREAMNGFVEDPEWIGRWVEGNPAWTSIGR